jgi:hypothetical protein
MTLENMSFNIQKVKDNDFEWFKAVIAGWVEAGTIEKCSNTAVTKKWESLTGLKLKNK